MLAIIQRDNPEIKTDEIVLSLVDIRSNSAHYFFKATATAFIAAATSLNVAINNNDLTKLPYKSIENLQTIWKFTNERNCVAELRGTGNLIGVAKISSETKIDVPSNFFLKGETVLYGKVERVGGAAPKLRIKLDDGVTLSVDITESDAKKLGSQIYDYVKLSGVARWRTDTYQIDEFKLHGIDSIKNEGALKSFEDLRDKYGQYFKDIIDPSEYIGNLRKD